MTKNIKTKRLGKIEAAVTKNNNIKYIDWSEDEGRTIGSVDVEYPKGEQLVLRSEKRPESTELRVFFGWRGYVSDINQASIESDNLIRLEEATIYEAGELDGWATPQGWVDGYESETFGDFVVSSWAVGAVDLVFATPDGQPLYTSEDVPLSATMEMRYEDWREEAHTGIMEELSLSQQADLISPVKGAGSMSERLEEAKADDLGSENLRRFLAIEPELKDFIGLLRSITQKPNERVAFEEKRIRAGTSSSAHGNTRAANVESFRSRGNSLHPEIVRSKSKKKVFTTEENAFVRRVNISLSKILNSVRKGMKKTLTTKKIKKEEYEDRWDGKGYKENDIHWKIIQEELEKYKGRIEEIERYIKMSNEVESKMKKMNISRSSSRINKDRLKSRKYKEIEKLYNKITGILDYVRIEDAKSYYASRPFSDMYEIWCFEKVHEALDNYDNFEKRGGEEKGYLYKNPEEDSVYCNFKHVEHEFLTIDLWYDKRFEHHTMDDAIYGLHRSIRDSTKHKPDIAIEFRHRSFNKNVAPSFVILDPISSKADPEKNKGNVSDLLKKTHYSRNIRILENTLGMKDEPIVDAAWGLYPGFSEKTDISQKKDESLEEGYLVMHPNRDVSRSQEKIIEIIEKRVISQV